MKMKSSLAVCGGFLFFCFCIGCDKSGLSQSERDDFHEMTKRFNEAADLMETVHDRQSYEKALPELRRFSALDREWGRKNREKHEKMSPAEQEKGKKRLDNLMKTDPDGQKLNEAAVRYGAEKWRLKSMPEVGEHFMKMTAGREEQAEKAEVDVSKLLKDDFQKLSQKFSEVIEILSTVNDLASYELAKPKLKSIENWRDEFAFSLFDIVHKLSDENRKKYYKGNAVLNESPEWKEIGRRLNSEIERVSRIPMVGPLFEKEIHLGWDLDNSKPSDK
jgi:hypothetical protein